MVDVAGILKSPLVLFALTISFFASGIFVNVIQLVLFVFVRPVNRRLFHTLNYYPRYWLLVQLVFVAEWWGGLEIVCYTAEGNLERYIGKEHAVCVFNHRYEIDWLAIFTICDRTRMFGNLRSFAKKALQYVPIIGSSLRMGGDVFLDRNWEKDKDVIGRQVTELVQYPSAMWLMMTAEGTRFNQEKHEASQKFAREKGLPLLRHHLTPRTKGFTHTVPYLRGRIDAVYDVQLCFKRGVEPTMVGLLKGEKYEAHFYINRIPISTLPKEEMELSKWVHELYQKKDRMTDSFFNTADFFLESGVPAVPAHRLDRRSCSLLTVLAWAAITLVPIFSYLIGMLMSGSLVSIGLVVGTIALSALLFLFMIRMTEIKKGSTHVTRTAQGSPTTNKTE